MQGGSADPVWWWCVVTALSQSTLVAPAPSGILPIEDQSDCSMVGVYGDGICNEYGSIRRCKVLPLFRSGELNPDDVRHIYDEYRNDSERLILKIHYPILENIDIGDKSSYYAQNLHEIVKDFDAGTLQYKTKFGFVKMCKRGTDLYNERVKKRLLFLLEDCNRCLHCGGFFKKSLPYCPDCFSLDYEPYSLPSKEMMPWHRRICPRCGYETDLVFRTSCPRCGGKKFMDLPVKGHTNILFVTLTQAVRECVDCGKYFPKTINGKSNFVCPFCDSPRVRYRDVREAWDKGKNGISEQWALFLKKIRKGFGKISYIRVWESREDYMPHIHALIVFNDVEFDVYQHIDKDTDEITYRLVDADIRDTIKSFWHSFVDVAGITSIKAGVDEVLKYVFDLNKVKGSKTHAMIWVFNKQSYAISSDFLQSIDGRLSGVQVREPGAFDLINGVMHNWNGELVVVSMVGVMPDRMLGISPDIYYAEMDKPPPRIVKLLKVEEERQALLRSERIVRSDPLFVPDDADNDLSYDGMIKLLKNVDKDVCFVGNVREMIDEYDYRMKLMRKKSKR